MSWLTPKPIVLVYTDGSCIHAIGSIKGYGGWAAVIVFKGEVLEISGSDKDTTNNRMEMTAALMALKTIPRNSHVFIFTDSEYLKNGIQYWINGWRKNGWKTTAGKEVANRDLWEQLEEENSQHVVTWHWIKGHEGDKHNERCDELAYAAAINCKVSS